MISESSPDWSRELPADTPSKKLLKAIRDYQKYKSRSPVYYPFQLYAAFRYNMWTILTGTEISINCQIGGGLILPHPNGVVIHNDAEIGPNCIIFQQVTIGTRHTGVPKIGGHVDIGAGAKILGGIEIGDHSKIGANAVVLESLPQESTAIGVPAKIIRKG